MTFGGSTYAGAAYGSVGSAPPTVLELGASDVDEFVTALNRFSSVQVTASDSDTSTYGVERERPLDIVALDDADRGLASLERERFLETDSRDIDESELPLYRLRELLWSSSDIDSSDAIFDRERSFDVEFDSSSDLEISETKLRSVLYSDEADNNLTIVSSFSSGDEIVRLTVRELPRRINYERDLIRKNY